MALTATDKTFLEGLAEKTSSALFSRFASRLSVLEERLSALEERQAAGLASFGELIPKPTDPSAIVEALREPLATLPAGVVEILHEEAPGLFGVKLEASGVGPLSAHYWLAEADAKVPHGGGTVNVTAGRVFDRRSHDVEALRRAGARLRRLHVAELDRYGLTEG